MAFDSNAEEGSCLRDTSRAHSSLSVSRGASVACRLTSLLCSPALSALPGHWGALLALATWEPEHARGWQGDLPEWGRRSLLSIWFPVMQQVQS